MESAPDTFFLVLGIGMLVGTLALLVWVLSGGMRRLKKPVSTIVPIEVHDLQAHIENWVASERFSCSIDKRGRLVVRTIRMPYPLYIIIGIGILVFSILIGIIWFVLANTYFVCTIERYYTGSKLSIETAGSGTAKTVAKLLATLPKPEPESILEDPSAPMNPADIS